MFIVVYHDIEAKGYSHFIGVADSYENAERIIAQDKKNTNEIRNYIYHIKKVGINYPCAFAIEIAVKEQPYVEENKVIYS